MAASQRQQDKVNRPPTQLPIAKQITAKVRLPSAAKLSWKICSKRWAIASSSARKRGQKVGSPVEPEDTAIMSQLSSRPSRQRSASG